MPRRSSPSGRSGVPDRPWPCPADVGRLPPRPGLDGDARGGCAAEGRTPAPALLPPGTNGLAATPGGLPMVPTRAAVQVGTRVHASPQQGGCSRQRGSSAAAALRSGVHARRTRHKDGRVHAGHKTGGACALGHAAAVAAAAARHKRLGIHCCRGASSTRHKRQGAHGSRARGQARRCCGHKGRRAGAALETGRRRHSGCGGVRAAGARLLALHVMLQLLGGCGGPGGAPSSCWPLGRGWSSGSRWLMYTAGRSPPAAPAGDASSVRNGTRQAADAAGGGACL